MSFPVVDLAVGFDLLLAGVIGDPAASVSALHESHLLQEHL